MPRALSTYECAVLAHVVSDPDAWWTWANDHHDDPEGAIAEKLTRWQADYDAAVLALGEAYQTRAQRDAETQGQP